MNPKVLRNGLVILFLLTAVNVYQTWAVLHYLNEARERHAQIEIEVQNLNAVVNQLCLNMHTACVYTLTSRAAPPAQEPY